MKSFLITLLFFFTFTMQKAQNLLPEFNDKPAYFDAKKNELVELEKSQYNTLAKAKGLFSAEAGFFLNGTTSSVKIPKQAELKFVVKVTSGTDPSSVFDLAKFEVRKDKRVLITSKAKVTSTTNSFEKINFEVKKIKEGFYYLMVKNLETGEYFFGSNENMFAFGVE